MELNKVLEQVRKLVERAEHESTPKAEAAACRERADSLMQKYLIEEWQLRGSAPQGLKPTKIRVDIGAGSSPLLQETATLAGIIADFCKCSSVWMSGSGWGSAQRQEYCTVYGYESDLRYFELLFTTLYLHMSGAMFPKPDSAKTTGENVSVLRKAGYNWVQVAEAFGWRLTDKDPKHTEFTSTDGEKALWNKVVSPLKAAYKKHCAAEGIPMVSLGRGGAGNMSFRLSAARGYLARISQRLREAASKREVGAELVLRDKTQNINDMVAAENPDMRDAKSKSIRYNADAYARGVAHANTANLRPGHEAGQGSAPAIGA
jgi:Protein of unknown function (DUF2786)